MKNVKIKQKIVQIFLCHLHKFTPTESSLNFVSHMAWKVILVCIWFGNKHMRNYIFPTFIYSHWQTNGKNNSNFLKCVICILIALILSLWYRSSSYLLHTHFFCSQFQFAAINFLFFFFCFKLKRRHFKTFAMSTFPGLNYIHANFRKTKMTTRRMRTKIGTRAHTHTQPFSQQNHAPSVCVCHAVSLPLRRLSN